MTSRDPAVPRHDWTHSEVEALFDLPFTELVFRAAEVHRRWFDPTRVQISRLLSVKTGGCPENCGYCSQSAALRDRRRRLQADGCRGGGRPKRRAPRPAAPQRFCMGAAWRDAEGPRPAEGLRHDLRR